MLILSPGSIRGCGNAKVVKAVVVMVTVLHGEGPCAKSFWGDCSVLTPTGQDSDLSFGLGVRRPYEHYLKTQFIQNYLLVSLGEKVTSLLPQFLPRVLLAFDSQCPLPTITT